MSIQGKMHRLYIIIDKIIENQNRDYYLSKKEIIDYLDIHDLSASSRTFMRDLDIIKYEFGISIEYDIDRRGYHIINDNLPKVQNVINFLELASTAEIITTNLQESKELLKHISFDNNSNSNQSSNLKILFHAIKERRVITFKHQNYTTNKTTCYSLEPILLKQYLNRWYIIGTISNSNDSRTFGVDRLQFLKVSNNTFSKLEDYYIEDKFEDIIGLNYNENKLETVELSFTKAHANYVKSLPWHKSQIISFENDKELRIKLTIKPNFELKQKILMLGSMVKVINPKYLANEIKLELYRSYNQY